MNVHFLMQYVSRELHTVVRRYDSSGELAETVCERPDLQDTEGTAEFLLPLFDGEIPLLASGAQSVSYAIVHGNSSSFLIGPVLLSEQGCVTCRLPEISYPHDWLQRLFSCEISALVKAALLIHNLFHTKTLSPGEVIVHSCLGEKFHHEIMKDYSDTVFENQETLTHHNPYDQEVREMASIRSGDVEQLRRSWAEDYTGKLGVLAKTRLRSDKNLAIVVMALSSRAAIEGGLIPEISYSLSDAYIQKIEEARTPEGALQLCREAEYQYTLLVHEQRMRQASPEKAPDMRVMRCKDYIFSHLHQKLSLSDIAAELQMSPNYLANLFRREEGISVGDYILNEKIKLAKNLLIYSPYSFSEIAGYLGFSSQSHLGDKFHKATGLTMGQYRKKYGVKEFLEP